MLLPATPTWYEIWIPLKRIITQCYTVATRGAEKAMIIVRSIFARETAATCKVAVPWIMRDGRFTETSIEGSDSNGEVQPQRGFTVEGVCRIVRTSTINNKPSHKQSFNMRGSLALLRLACSILSHKTAPQFHVIFKKVLFGSSNITLDACVNFLRRKTTSRRKCPARERKFPKFRRKLTSGGSAELSAR